MEEVYVIVGIEIEDRLMEKGIFAWVNYYPSTDRLFVETDEGTTIVSGVTELIHRGCSSKQMAEAIIRSIRKHKFQNKFCA